VFDRLEKLFYERSLRGTKPTLMGVGYTESDPDMIVIVTEAGEAYFHKSELSDLIDTLMEYEEEMEGEL